MKSSVFVTVSIDMPVWVRKFKQQDLLTVSLETSQRVEQDSHVMTMIGSFLNCSGATSTCLLEEAMLEEGASQGTCRLVGTLLKLELSAICCPER